MSTTKVPNFMVSPTPPSESETTASLSSLSNRLNTLENLSISSRLSSIEANYVTTDTNQTLTGTKTLKSNLDLNPPTVNSNTGGQINFHYNQSANTTSSIVENASGQIKVNGDLELNGKLRSATSTIYADKVYCRCVNLGTGIRPTTSTIAPRCDSTIVFNNEFDNKTLSSIYNPLKYNSDTDWQNSIQLLVYDLAQESRHTTLQLGFNQNGAFTLAPTPAVTSNDGSIATTAFVNSRLPYTAGNWTPVLHAGGSAVACTYTTRSAFYVRIGRVVHFYMNIVGKCTTQPTTGQVQIRGLPFTPATFAMISGILSQDFCDGGTNNCFRKVSDAYIGNMWFCLQADRCFVQGNGERYCNFVNDTSVSSTVGGSNLCLRVNETFTIRFAGSYITT